MISLIVAHSKNYAIGIDGWMPWDLPEDLKHFKEKTIDKKIVMGRTTFECMKKPLPRRFTYVVTRNSNFKYDHESVEVITDFKKLLEEYKDSEEELIICGGAKIYNYALPYVDKMWISLVDNEYDADTFFPNGYEKEFKLVNTINKEGFKILEYTK